MSVLPSSSPNRASEAGADRPGRLTNFALGIALALFSLTAVLVWRQADEVRESSTWVARSQAVRAELAQLLSAVQDVETGTRGYALTGDPAYLIPFEKGVAELAALQAELARLTLDAEQEAALSALRPLIAERIALAQRVVDLRRTSGVDKASAEVRSGRGRQAMDRIRARIAALEARQRRLLETRVADAREAAILNRALILGGAGVGVLLVGGAFHLLRREMRMRAQAQADAEARARALLFEMAERERLELERDRFFDLSPDILTIATMDGYFKRVNPAFTRIVGWSPEVLTSQPFLSFVHPDDIAGTLAEVEKLKLGHPTIRFANRYRHGLGGWRWLSWKVQPFPAEGVQYATARDVTAEKQAELEMQMLNENLQAANRELEAFSYTVSHDLRAPLRAIDGFVRILEEDHGPALADDARRCIGVVRDNARRMGQLIDDLLAFARLGRQTLVPERVDMRDLVQGAVAQVLAATPTSVPRVEIDVLPDAHGDARLLQQVWINLVGNAVKYSAKASEPAVRISGVAEADGVHYRVADNGVGFDMKYADQLFGVFQRLHHGDEFEGTGVGLAIVERVVRRHGGKVWAEAVPGAGATFHFMLPAG